MATGGGWQPHTALAAAATPPATSSVKVGCCCICQAQNLKQTLVVRTAGRLLDIGGQRLAGLQLQHEVAAPSELETGLVRQQCPRPWGGRNVSIAFLHVPKTAGDAEHVVS